MRGPCCICDNARPCCPFRAVSRIDQTPVTVTIRDLSHDGRGVARWPDTHRQPDKAVFVTAALPGEQVSVQQTGRSRHFDEARTLEVLQPSPDRVQPRCPHVAICSGCVLQHLAEDRQIAYKQQVLLDNLQRIGHVQPQTVLPPLTDSAWGYRRKGRFSVRHVAKKGKTLVGFREHDARFVADLSECHTVVPAIGMALPALSALVDGLEQRAGIPQIEFIMGDPQLDFDGVALVIRHLHPLPDADRERLQQFAQAQRMAIFLQPGGVDSVQPLWPPQPQLWFALPEWDLQLQFRPLDFIQVNAGLNRKMIAQALQLLDPQPDDRVLDLFCGLGNFSLPLARQAREVVGVEGDAGLVQRARDNARHNGLENASFHQADLAQDLRGQPWMKAGFDRLLLDPARAGADAVLKQLPLQGLRRIVYVSCHPGSLARDAGYLVNERGWALRSVGVMDMFPHTAHVESIAVFEPR